MKWTKLSEYAITNGIYNISKSGKDEDVKFTLWKLGIPDKIMGFFKDANEARRYASEQ